MPRFNPNIHDHALTHPDLSHRSMLGVVIVDKWATIDGPSWLASTAIAELGAAIDLLDLVDRHVDAADVASHSDAEQLRSMHRHQLADASARALLSIGASLAILCKAHEIEDPSVLARMWADGYRTGRADEAGDLPIDPRAIDPRAPQ